MLRDDLTAWLSDLADSERKASTVATYRKRSRWIMAAFGDRDWESLTEPQLRRAIDEASRRRVDGRGSMVEGKTNDRPTAALNSRPSTLHPQPSTRLAPDTIRLIIIVWEQFQKWGIETGRLERPVNARPLKKPAGQLRQRLPTPAEIQRIVKAAHPAFRTVFRALLLTGARPDELCRATIADYDPVRQMIRLQDHKTVRKTRKPRLIPISTACRVIVRQALGDRREGPLFLSPRGRPWTAGRLSEAFRRLRRRLELSPEIVLYATRHTAATNIVRQQGIGQAAAVLGHSGLQTIQRYVHPDERDLVQWVEDN